MIVRTMNVQLHNLKRIHPFLYEQMVAYECKNEYDVYITLKDGSTVLYDDFDKSFRQLPSSINLTEEQCRKEFAYRLRRIMKRKRITQEVLSSRSGINQSQISSYITGKRLPNLYSADRIAKALGCSIDELRYC